MEEHTRRGFFARLGGGIVAVAAAVIGVKAERPLGFDELEFGDYDAASKSYRLRGRIDAKAWRGVVIGKAG